MAYNKNLNIGSNNTVNISGSLIAVTGQVTGSEISGSRLQSTIVSASVVSASQYLGLNLTGGLDTDYIDFVGQEPAPAYQSGRVYYNGSGSYFAGTEITDLNINLGQQVIIRCQNKSGDIISKGKVVYIVTSSNNSDTPLITTASYSAESSSAQTLGMVMRDIADNANGYIILYGVLTNISTVGYTDGQMLYLADSGSITGSGPVAPKHNVRIGQVVRGGQSNGSIFVRVQNGYELDEIHDVLITSEQNGDLLVHDSSTNLWKNSKTLSGSYQITNNLTASAFSMSAPSAIDVSSSTEAFRVTQRGTGPSILVEDQANPDNSPFIVDADGNVGVGTSSPNAKLDINGNTIVSGNLTVTGSISELSTRRIKTDIISLNNELTTISKLNPVSYTRIDDGRREYGFLSEEMKEVYPEFVVGEGINYPKMVSILVSAVKELTQKVDSQSKEIELLKNKKKTTRGKK